MKKNNMYARTIEMSDSELEDDEDFSISKKDINLSNHSQKNSALERMDTFDQYHNMCMDDEQILEFCMINACTVGHLEVIEEYLEFHNVNDFLHTGWTPLLYAASCAEAETIEYLIMNGADVNKHKDGYTPLMTLCSSSKGTPEKRMKCLTLLLKANANVNATNKRRQTPLMYACQTQEPEFVEELIKRVKNINTSDSLKQTALIYATLANKPKIVTVLIESTVDVTLTDYNNLTAKDIASMKGYDKILSLLYFNEEEEEEEELINVEIHKIHDWTDMFPSWIKIKHDTIDFDVFTILRGMHLEKYSRIFHGMNIKTFLKLSENDLFDIGVEINAHRVQFMEYLHQFHRKKWSIHSIGVINKSSPYTLHDGVVSLGTVAKQIAIIGCSFQYIKNCLLRIDDEKMYILKEQICNYEKEIKKTRRTLNILKKELVQVRALSEKIKKKNDKHIGNRAVFIPRPRHSSVNWPFTFLSITVILGIYLCRTVCIHTC